MTWREKTVIRILMLVAVIVADRDDLERDVKQLANHISVHAKEDS